MYKSVESKLSKVQTSYIMGERGTITSSALENNTEIIFISI